MSKSIVEPTLEEELSKERQIVYEKLSSIFDPETAIDYVRPKTNENRQDNSSLEDLKLLNFNDQQEYLQRLRSLVHYKTTTRSLSHADLEAAYQSFVRDQVAQQTTRLEMEQFVRNSSDIDSAKRYLEMANEVLVNPHQSLLLFRSSKLNEQKANLLKSSGCINSLQQLNEEPSIRKYFSEILNNTSRDPIQHEEEYCVDKQNFSRSRSMHLQHNEKKYHVKFLKDYDAHHPSYRSTNNRRTPLTERLTQRNIESLFGSENSILQGHSTESNIHRENFPPLSLSALKEYRPTFTPKPPTLRKTSLSTVNIRPQTKPTRKADFIWNQSIVSSTKPK